MFPNNGGYLPGQNPTNTIEPEVNETPSNKAYWESQSPSFRLLRYLVGQVAFVKAMELHRNGDLIFKQIDILKNDPQTEFDTLANGGYTWIPEGFSNYSIPVSPKIASPDGDWTKNYNPENPPMGVRVLWIGNLKKGPNYKDNPFDYTVEAIDVVESFKKNDEPDLFNGGPGQRVAENTYFPIGKQEEDTFPCDMIFGFKGGMFVKRNHSGQYFWHLVPEDYVDLSVMEVG